ncbi:MAG: hypothetical protein KatS3mg013_0556 [Actinomycetota bacterium]|nr:MAG: hypothetical protein KatS3mg013_0556 [Actinomycetota bacterium]
MCGPRSPARPSAPGATRRRSRSWRRPKRSRTSSCGRPSPGGSRRSGTTTCRSSAPLEPRSASPSGGTTSARCAPAEPRRSPTTPTSSRTLAGERAIRRLAGRAERAGRVLDALIEIDFTRERGGVVPEEAERVVDLVARLPSLRLRGLMTIPPIGRGAEGRATPGSDGCGSFAIGCGYGRRRCWTCRWGCRWITRSRSRKALRWSASEQRCSARGPSAADRSVGAATGPERHRQQATAGGARGRRREDRRWPAWWKKTLNYLGLVEDEEEFVEPVAEGRAGPRAQDAPPGVAGDPRRYRGGRSHHRLSQARLGGDGDPQVRAEALQRGTRGGRPVQGGNGRHHEPPVDGGLDRPAPRGLRQRPRLRARRQDRARGQPRVPADARRRRGLGEERERIAGGAFYNQF